ncbi:MAG: DUF1565 domain-containing protein [Bacteroidota bacterium]|nr:DUF1565 domain-containing protein [Bacteroidota bacterium]
MKKILILYFFFPLLSYSQTITVKQDGTGDYTAIQDAIDNANNGDTVIVWPGTYYENVNYQYKGIILGSLTMTTGDPSYISQTVINGNQSGCCIYIRDNNHVCEVNGFTLTNGSGTNNLGKNGGGIYIVKSYKLQVNNCIIEGNQMVGEGGGIYCVEVEEGLYLSGTTIRNNQVFEDGGGIVIGRSPVYFDSENLCNIYLNYAAYGNDIAKAGDEVLTLNLDTFTVINPDKHFILNHGNEDNIILNINNGKIQPVNSDLYVNPTGSNDNSGLTPDDPLRNISFAMIKTLPDTNDPKSIYLANGTYAPSGGEMFPFALRGYISIIGESRDSAILDGEDTTFIMQGNKFTDNYQVKNLTICNANSNINWGTGAIYLYQNHESCFENILLTQNKGLYRSAIQIMKCNNLMLKNISITNNIGGDAIMILQYPDSSQLLYSADTVCLQNCNISYNLPDYDTVNYGLGGGLAIFGFDLYHDSLTAYITNCLIVENLKKYHVGLNFSGILVNWGAKTFLTNSTIGNNYDEGDLGACIGVADNSELNVYNSVIYDNLPAQFFMDNEYSYWHSDLNIYNSLVQDGHEGIRIYSPGNTIHYDSTNIDANPSGPIPATILTCYPTAPPASTPAP